MIRACSNRVNNNFPDRREGPCDLAHLVRRVCLTPPRHNPRIQLGWNKLRRNRIEHTGRAHAFFYPNCRNSKRCSCRSAFASKPHRKGCTDNVGDLLHLLVFDHNLEVVLAEKGRTRNRRLPISICARRQAVCFLSSGGRVSFTLALMP